MARIKLHEQVRRRIERLIADQAIKPGAQIPTETDLAGEFNVSRTTIRNALNVLEQEGKIERTRGRGTIVRQPRLGQLLGKLLSLYVFSVIGRLVVKFLQVFIFCWLPANGVR